VGSDEWMCQCVKGGDSYVEVNVSKFKSDTTSLYYIVCTSILLEHYKKQ